MTLLAAPVDLARRFAGISRLYGADKLKRFQAAHVCVIGLGGVGSWAVEALARSGIGKLTLIDLDNICESNVNRQLPALDPNFGCAKVDVLAQRVKAINPSCLVHEIEDFLTVENIDDFLHGKFSYLVDAIDDLRAKAALSAWCVRNKQPFIVSGGAGGRINPSQIALADLAQVKGDALLSKLRYRLRRDYGFSREAGNKLRVPCVYSAEQIIKPEQICSGSQSLQGLSCAGFGASMAVTASFAMYAVAEVLKKL